MKLVTKQTLFWTNSSGPNIKHAGNGRDQEVTRMDRVRT